MRKLRQGGRAGLAAVVWAGVVLAPMASLAAGPEAERPEAPVDEQTARQYNEFRQRAMSHTPRLLEGITKRYGLDADQQGEAGEIIAEMAEAFLARHGRGLFDVYQRGRAVGEFLREEGMTLEELPLEVKQDLADRAVVLLEATQKAMLQFTDRLAGSLNADQRAILAGERLKMMGGFAMALARARTFGGRPAAGAPSGPSTRPAPPRRPGGRRPRGLLDKWERYVRRFIARYRLDEIQKLRAMDLLAEYKARLKEMPRPRPPAATTRPATQPGKRIASVEALRRRLEDVHRQRQPIRDLFEKLKGELDRIPTPVQRRLAEERKPPASGRADRRGPMRPEKSDRKEE